MLRLTFAFAWLLYASGSDLGIGHPSAGCRAYVALVYAIVLAAITARSLETDAR